MSTDGLNCISEEASDGVTDAEDGDLDVQDDFKKIIKQYDENIVNTLMPFMVNILDCMNIGYQQKLEYEAKLQRILKENVKFQNKEKQEKLILEQQVEEYTAKFEREREARIFLENRIAEYEKSKDKERQAMQNRVEALEIHVQTLEKKFKISTTCIEKLEDRETYLKKEYSGLLEKYTKLFKEHVEFMEKSNLPRLHHELLNEGFLNVNKNDETDTETITNNVSDTEVTNPLSDNQSSVINDKDSSTEQDIENCYEEPQKKGKEENPNQSTLLDELSLTQSIKNISRIPLKRCK